MKAKIRNASELKHYVQNNASHESYFFTRDTMRFFGDTMKNYGIRQPREIKCHDGTTCNAYELTRRRPVRHGLKDSAFFCAETFNRVHPETSKV